LASAVVLVVAAVVALLVAMRCIAVALGSSFWPLAGMSVTQAADRIALLAVALVVALVLLVLVLWSHDEGIEVASGEHGAIVIDGEALAAFARDAVAHHPDVVNVDAAARMRGGVLIPEAYVVVRPLADSGALRAEFQRRIRESLTAATGLEVGEPRLHLKVLTVRRLRRYL
jgi:hypothetical protein